MKCPGWLQRITGMLQVASDLRFMIDKRFAEENIVLAFPQRDVHLDCAERLRVEIVRSPLSNRPAKETWNLIDL